MNTVELPLFPLNTVLFPGGPLPLRVFEARYIDMISQCIRSGTGFGVCLISAGREVGEAAETHEIGTLATVIDWHMRHDGLLGITAHGGQRFRIADSEVRKNQLRVARVEMLPEDPHIDLPAKYLPLVDLLRKLIDQAGHHYATLHTRYADAAWVGYRLAEMLPFGSAQKQYLLQMDDALARLEMIFDKLRGTQVF